VRQPGRHGWGPISFLSVRRSRPVVTTISEIARAADVSVESVLHVLNRDGSVSSEVVARVEAAMDAYGYRPQPADSEPVERRPEPASSSEPSAQKGSALLSTGNVARDVAEETRLQRQGRPLAERMTVIDGLFDRLAKDLDEIKNELGQARSERLEDLTLLVDLLTTSWRAADHRLRAIERKLEQIEQSPEQPSSNS
jgi:hypothetical protein